MAENRDIAFCFRGWAYDTGKVDRPKRRVIRISRAHDSRRAKGILSLNDTTDAGLVITPKEEDIEGVDHGLLAVVVGGLLPAAEVPNHKELSKPAPLHSFDPDIHSLVETRPQTRLVEWTHGVAGTQGFQRTKVIRHNINSFCSEFRGETQKEPPQQTLSSPLADQGDHDQIYESSTSKELAYFISTVASAYKTFPCKTYLQLAIGRFRESEQTSLSSLSAPGVASREVIRDMMEGKGDLIEEQAKCVINAFKELWPYQFEAVGEHRINISAVLELAKGLCSISASGITIHESLYLGVIVSFCTMFSNSHAVNAGVGEYHDSLIQSAISIARGSAPAPISVRPLIRDSHAHMHAHMENFKAWRDAGACTCTHGGGPRELHKVVRVASVVLGTQNQEAIVTALGQVKRLVLASAFELLSRTIASGNEKIEVIQAVLQATVHVVAADVVEKFATQADQESETMDAQPTLPGLPANLAKLADKVSDLYHALGSVKEEDTTNAVREAIKDYEENE
ncbi:hypothetical protein NCS57_00720900 [Fusarium keratoplasticum]|uniref:Uncharacterized protein n=1 Tax=Fusarium keratoplasticum TaxID=1328300 RepID=A0ACC0QVQ7_9HYPO|nr:hypothetical protein NCS57_00720900 [Fusarium keratoplasticum]KAI8669069.1 hypothetical protein NCS57_00720900 [Fusarium keratoplasticum]